ncbi:signal transduction protein [Sphingomonas sp. AP4-R1]|uniref:signal transduction protein n=1 Tax=Sphingomonas sp. AP4-R1 TaxID=2735134 RepID=UPI0014939C0B|nr:signal transduction protein [Sphingomonas sp. AP4-R1]QJU58964.1 signal transduction protein [Sphingomonas sp. AP4-R1]
MNPLNVRFLVAGLLLLPVALTAQTAPLAAGMSLADFQSAGRSRMMALDVDGDGKISAKEFAARPGAAKAKGRMAKFADRMFDRLDTNKDGALDKGEIDAMLATRFQRMDTDKDGILSAAEREAARERLSGMMARQ